MLVISSCKKNGGGPNSNADGDIIYLETNDYNGNAILAYYHENDSMLIALPGSPFSTGGNGIANPTQGLGPDDDDNQVRITSDKRFLMAVNAGSNTIAVFKILNNGLLSPVAGSPFPSGGNNPVSIGESGKYFFVVNKGVTSVGSKTTVVPNYTTFTMDNEGKLYNVPNSTFETTPGTSPSQALVSNDGHFLFGADFLGFMDTPAVGTLRSFVINNNGTLAPVAGTPLTIPQAGGALGLWQHPAGDVLYVGFPVAGMIGIYKFNQNTGALSFNNSVISGPAVCWLRTSSNGNNLYALNSGENTVSVFNSSTASSLSSLQKLVLKNSGPLYSAMSFTTSEDFSLSFSPSGKNLYVISQYTNPDLSLGNYNLLHVLKVNNDGTLTEPATPLALPVPSSVRPQGVVSYNP